MCFQGSISAGEEYSISVSACEGNIHEIKHLKPTNRDYRFKLEYYKYGLEMCVMYP